MHDETQSTSVPGSVAVSAIPQEDENNSSTPTLSVVTSEADLDINTVPDNDDIAEIPVPFSVVPTTNAVGILTANHSSVNSPKPIEDKEKCTPVCKPTRNELCQKVVGVMRCICRPGFTRMFPDRLCNQHDEIHESDEDPFWDSGSEYVPSNEGGESSDHDEDNLKIRLRKKEQGKRKVSRRKRNAGVQNKDERERETSDGFFQDSCSGYDPSDDEGETSYCIVPIEGKPKKSSRKKRKRDVAKRNAGEKHTVKRGTQTISGIEMGAAYQISGPATSLSGSDAPDTKDGIEELCPVCGDKVSGYHYGLLTCESCKGFFKRTVQNKKVYTCVAERSCHIDKTQRKRCPFCRFQKCLDVGMKLEAVRADRMRGGRNKFGPMYKRDRARKLQMMRQRQLAAQTLRGAQLNSDGMYSNQPGTSPFANIHIKQEIQIPQVSSLTSSPDSSPSPIAVALGPQMQLSGTTQPALQIVGVPSGPAQNPNIDQKLWGSANSTTTSPHSLSPKSFQFDTVVSGVPQNKVSPLIREFVQAIDDREWQNSLYGLLQSQTYNQCEVDLFELMCKVLDQNLFSQVDWARNSIFFKDLKVDDQMKLLQHSWSDMLVLDHIHQRMHNNLPDETTLHNGQKFDLLSLGLLGVPSLVDHFNNITAKLQELKFDISDYICVKFMLLLNPEVRGITNKKHVLESYEQVQQALLEYCLTCYPQIQEKFNKMQNILQEIHSLAARGEEHLYLKHCNGSAPTQTLLMEMLHAKRK